MIGIRKSYISMLVGGLYLILALIFCADPAGAKSYKNHKCEACQYLFRVDTEADYVKCPACGYESSLDSDDESEDSSQSKPNAGGGTDSKPLSTKKQIKKSLKEAKNEMIEATVNSLVNKVAGGEGVGSATQFESGAVNGQSRPRTESVNNGMVCSKCGHTAAFFPYADSTKKALKCPSCGTKRSMP